MSEVGFVAHDEHPNPNNHDDPPAMPVLTVGVASALLVVAAVFVLTGLYYQTETELKQAANGGAAQQAAQLKADQDALLRTPAWVDKDAGVVRIPIDDAIKLVGPELAASPDGVGPWSPKNGGAAANE